MCAGRSIPSSRQTLSCFGNESCHCLSQLVKVKRLIQDGVNRVIGAGPSLMPGYHEDGLPRCQLLDFDGKFTPF